MGCDIHFHVEVNRDGRWHGIINQSWYCNRNYDLFAILAGVRNYDNLTPISEPKGLPEDLSDEIKTFYSRDSNSWHIHSESWLLLSEVLEINWNQIELVSAVIDEHTYLGWDRVSSPVPRCRGVLGAKIITVSEKNYLQLKELNQFDPNKKYYIQISWPKSLRDMCPEFFCHTIPKIKEIHSDPTQVRLVFWFDN